MKRKPRKQGYIVGKSEFMMNNPLRRQALADVTKRINDDMKVLKTLRVKIDDISAFRARNILSEENSQ